MPSLVLRALGFVMAVFSLGFVPPVALAWWDGELAVLEAFAAPMAVSWLLSCLMVSLSRRGVKTRDASNAFVIVACAWLVASFLGALPFYLSGCYPSVADAVFESVSGFTTTGASVIADVESLPRSINFWRCETHFLGGMGVIALVVAILPLLGEGGFSLIKAESSGPEKGKITSRIADTAKALWLIYAGMTAVQALMLNAAGMNWFESVCHAFSTMGTGGFSTRNASVGGYHSSAIEWICTVFMLLATVNFALYYQMFSGRFSRVRRNSELKVFGMIVLLAVAAVTAIQFAGPETFPSVLRGAAFQVASIVSTTGFMTEDYLLWAPASHVILLSLFLIGGCSGSTAGGVKVIRWTVLAKQLRNEIRRLRHPHGVFTLRINGVSGRDEMVSVVGTFVFVYMALALLTTFVGALGGLDLLTAFTGALSMVGNVGPAFGALGPTANCGFLPDGVKWWYCMAMLAGRLEIYTFIILGVKAFRSAMWYN